MSDWKEIDSWAQEKWPTVYKLLYPKVYEFEGDYYSPRMPASYMILGLSHMLDVGVTNSYTSYQLMLPAAGYMAQHMMPTFFIAPDLLKAVQLTDIHEEINWVDLKLPFESAVFILPRNGFSHETSGDCAFILFTRHKSGFFNFPGAEGNGQYYNDHCFSILGCTPATGTWYHANLNASFSHTTKLRNLFKTEDGRPSRVECLSTPSLDMPLDAKDDPFVTSLGVIVFGTILAMTARPDLLEQSKLIRKVSGKKGKSDREFWTPNIIGKNYRIRRELGGSHASPRMHWRRGHYRNHAFGKDLSERKRIWLEPCLVAAEKPKEEPCI